MKDLVDEYCASDIEPCPVFKEGDQIILDNINETPQGFCSWAWADIQREIALLDYGGIPRPELKKRDSEICCCCEGLRPVFFLIEYFDTEEQLQIKGGCRTMEKVPCEAALIYGQ